MFSSMTQTSLFAAVLAMASTTSAHMFIQSPVPFAGVSKSPLDPSGSNFPCQGSSYQITTMNDWSVGSEVTVSFPSDQTATHGGGSCQISVTKDEKPTKDSKWKVIHSIEGGCPTTGSGNGGPLGTFGFKVPSSLPDGQLTMAWTWFNKVGNREMYMNCAPIKVSGGSGKGFDSLPDMAIANINAGGSTCKTSEGADYTFANPGESVVKLTKGPFKELCGGAASDSGSTGSSGSAAGSGNTGSSGSTGTSGGSSSSSGSGSGSAPAASASPATPAASAAPVASAAPAAPAASAAPAAPQSPATGGSASGGSTCSENGAILCNGESQFGICNNGGIVYQPVAAGTKCSNGAITRRDLHRNARTVIPLF